MDDLIITERQNIIDIADAIRNKTGLENEMTLADMVTEINSIETGSSSSASMFVSNASGILPTIYKGAANSTLALEFESSATGALQEG